MAAAAAANSTSSSNFNSFKNSAEPSDESNYTELADSTSRINNTISINNYSLKNRNFENITVDDDYNGTNNDDENSRTATNKTRNIFDSNNSNYANINRINSEHNNSINQAKRNKLEHNCNFLNFIKTKLKLIFFKINK